MARTRQTARKSIGGKAPRKKLASDGKLKVPYNPVEERPNDVSVEYDVSYESSFYAHFFETGVESSKSFAPRYAVAQTKNPFDEKETEYWLSVNFNSKFDGNGIQIHSRPSLNLVVALDVSGSMQSYFQDENDSSIGKLEVAKKALLAIIGQLKDDDFFGLMTFEDHSHIIQPLTKWKDTDKTKLTTDITAIHTFGGTDVSQAMNAATAMYAKVEEGTNSSNRIFFLTDMQVSTDDGDTFSGLVKKNSDDSLWTTVVGIGLDLTSTVIERVSKTPGCNYSNVRSSSGFEELMQNEFGFLVTPIGFNIVVEMESNQFMIQKGFGSPEISEMKPGAPVTLSTEFPSAQNDKGERRGGALLFKVAPKGEILDGKFKMLVKHDNLQGIVESDTQELQFKNEGFQDNGIRKSILMVRYTDFILDYINKRKARTSSKDDSINYKEHLENFLKYFQSEKTELSDESLQQEIEFMATLVELETKPDIVKEKKLKEENKTILETLDKMTVAMLKEALERRGCDATGIKKVLAARLKAFVEKAIEDETNEDGKQEMPVEPVTPEKAPEASKTKSKRKKATSKPSSSKKPKH